MTETWMPVHGFEGLYEVSDLGNVRSFARGWDGRPLRSSPNGRGYMSVNFWKGNRATSHRVHRLVLEAFVGLPPDGMEGCHNDGNKRNNQLSNLRWDTRSANARDKGRHGNDPNASKSHCPSGHPYDSENTYYRPTGRGCNECRRAAVRKYRAKNAKESA
jgi:hypothetical protein